MDIHQIASTADKAAYGAIRISDLRHRLPPAEFRLILRHVWDDAPYWDAARGRWV